MERAFRGALSFLDERRAWQDLQVPRLIEKKPCQGGKIGRNGASDWHDGKYKVLIFSGLSLAICYSRFRE
jgi:hypothetical protein